MITQLMVGIIIIAILYMLVRPSSPGPAIIEQLSSALTDLVKSSTGYGTTSNG
jgi:Tfp pilus assembly protein FimT